MQNPAALDAHCAQRTDPTHPHRSSALPSSELSVRCTNLDAFSDTSSDGGVPLHATGRSVNPPERHTGDASSLNFISSQHTHLATRDEHHNGARSQYNSDISEVEIPSALVEHHHGSSPTNTASSPPLPLAALDKEQGEEDELPESFNGEDKAETATDAFDDISNFGDADSDAFFDDIDQDVNRNPTLPNEYMYPRAQGFETFQREYQEKCRGAEASREVKREAGHPEIADELLQRDMAALQNMSLQEYAQHFRDNAAAPGGDEAPILPQNESPDIISVAMFLVKVFRNDVWPTIYDDIKDWCLRKHISYDRFALKDDYLHIELPLSQKENVDYLLRQWHGRPLTTDPEGPCCVVSMQEFDRDITKSVKLPLC